MILKNHLCRSTNGKYVYERKNNFVFLKEFDIFLGHMFTKKSSHVISLQQAFYIAL